MRIRIGNGEFGEVYHAACAYILDETVTVEFEDFAAGQEFFNAFVVGDPRDHLAGEEVAHPGETANVIRDAYYEGCLDEVSTEILQRAQDENWVLPPQFNTLMTKEPKVLLWHRNKTYKAHRNSTAELIRQLADLCRMRGTKPILIGPDSFDTTCYELGEFWTHEFFNEHSIAKQLWSIDQVFRGGSALANVGVMSGAMDGIPMFFGHKTVFLARHRDATPRMQKVAGSVPNLIWQQIEFSGNLATLNDSDLAAIERLIWC
ncbi:hypothetical protein [Bremerella sp. P1]|uniref:hypothetical protein n=1 Tax=Bremerella sp. P1 TaxID=3026424 RepID=UPI002367C65B|nr:hypothetical protein [Bremerella sp. P1]WDI40532.1 hypothetical protein PSR63_18825 [Bremerella sp. P1]